MEKGNIEEPAQGMEAIHRRPAFAGRGVKRTARPHRGPVFWPKMEVGMRPKTLYIYYAKELAEKPVKGFQNRNQNYNQPQLLINIPCQ